MTSERRAADASRHVVQDLKPGSVLPDDLDCVEADEAITAEEHLARRMADASFYQRIVEQNFVGTAYDVLAADLVAYAFPTMKSWLRHGTIFARCAEIGRAVPHSDRDHERIATSLDDRDELAYETIAEALALFVQLGKKNRGWSPAGGAALATYFVGTCVGCFPNVWRRWRNEQQRHALHDHMGGAGDFDSAAQRALDSRISDDPADVVASRELVRTTLECMQGDLRGIAEQLVLHGSTLTEICVPARDHARSRRTAVASPLQRGSAATRNPRRVMSFERGILQHVTWLAGVLASRGVGDTSAVATHRGSAAGLRDAVTVDVLSSPGDFRAAGDADLIASVREGKMEAYGLLYERHVGPAFNLGLQLARSEAEAEDLVADAFVKVLGALRSGGGPHGAFRPYLLTALRHTAYDRARREKRLELSDDLSDVAPPLPFKDTVVADQERALAARAFAALPERWQTVLWHTEIEGLSFTQAAALMGMTARGVSSLAHRAREGLRQAYRRLDGEPVLAASERCSATESLLGAWVRDDLPKGERLQFERHLRECARCRASAADFVETNVDRRTLATLEAVETMHLLNATSLGTVRARHSRQATSVRAVAEILNRAELKTRSRA